VLAFAGRLTSVEQDHAFLVRHSPGMHHDANVDNTRLHTVSGGERARQ